jgi:hypothetical protein
MGTKLCWSGLFLVSCGATFTIPQAAWLGAVVFLLGLILLWLDK